MKIDSIFKILTLALFAYLFFIILKPFLPSIILALAFAMVFYPFSKKLGQKLKLPQGTSAFLTVLITLIFILLPLSLLVGLIGKQAFAFAKSLDLESLKQSLLNMDYFEKFGYSLEMTTLKEKGLEALQQVGTYLSSKSGAILSTLSNSLFLFFVFLLLYYYFLKDAAFLLSRLKAVLPYSEGEQKALFGSFHQVSRTIFYGNLLSALVAGGMAYVGFWLFGLGGALIWALLAAVLSFIPTAGTLLVYLAGVGVTFFSSGWMMAVLMALYFVLMELGLRENWIKPKLMEDKLNLHPILVFFALVGGVSAFGSLGLIYGPLIVTFLATFWGFYTQKPGAI